MALLSGTVGPCRGSPTITRLVRKRTAHRKLDLQLTSSGTNRLKEATGLLFVWGGLWAL
jgi:hypothetical protein